MSGPTLVDGHVHVHPCFDLGRFLRSAVDNFRLAGSEAPGVLLLTESAGARFFEDARRASGEGPPGDWRFRETSESSSLVVEHEGTPVLVIVAGRQVVTSESLEVLGIGIDGDWPDGGTLRATIETVRADGAMAGIPWGFGKWWFGRGRRVADVVSSAAPGEIFLGDNGGRPRVGIRPPLFRKAETRGIRVLPGSDPLPFPDQARRPGTRGFVLGAALSLDHPVRDLRAALYDPGVPTTPYGSGERIVPFVKCQIAMQLHKRRRPDR